ncbi:DUF116 domain-containing protein [Methanobacterium oryzae]|uniref:DUF116 domain-containing protein n=1 Tax=Methanobacterium oryzae TaxID=69540 RepID=UPI003D1F9014
MESITYSLKRSQNNSNQYYEDVRIFTDELLREFENYENSIISDFILYIKEGNIIEIRSCNEYIFEFLMLGIFWKVYSSRASRLDENPQKLLENFASERQKNQPAKETIDLIRGMLMTPFLVPKNEDNDYLHELNLDNIGKLLGYLKATGDFSQEVKPLKIWKNFLTTKTPEEVSKFLSNAISFAEWFEKRSKIRLGKYTSNINEFLKEKSQEHLFKEDVLFCSRKEVEYHMNMVGAEIMNRAFKNEFNERPRKALLLPGCMRRSQEFCKAEETKLGLRCTGCMKNCNINTLRDIGDKNRFEVYVISHESSAFSKSKQKDRDELGIIGVACISNLIAGGWKSNSLGIPAQCVLLDSASCQNHWDSHGIPTNINIEYMMKLFNIKSEEYCKLEPIPAHY